MDLTSNNQMIGMTFVEHANVSLLNNKWNLDKAEKVFCLRHTMMCVLLFLFKSFVYICKNTRMSVLKLHKFNLWSQYSVTLLLS